MAMPPTKPRAVNAVENDFGNVKYVRAEVQAAMPRWRLIQDCISGQDAVKARTDEYLPVPDSDDGGKTTDIRYKNYIARAIYYNVTGRTLTGLVGQVFGRETIIELPAELEFLREDVGGEGVGLNQQAKKTFENVVGFGRCGLYVDFPKTDGAVTRAQQDSGEVRPIIKRYNPANVINWRTKRIGAKVVLSLVVLVETIDTEDDGFEAKTAKAYRVLRLNEKNEYTVQVYIENDEGGETKYDQQDLLTPKDADGKPFKEIPFTFVGPENNDPQIDEAPLYALATLNIGHYRNSADYEDSCFVSGQPTPYFSGLTEEWVKNVMEGKVHLGSRGGIMLPKDGAAGLLQAQSNSMPKEAMEHKEHQMVALGAKLVEERTIRRTATEAKQDEASETSILGSSAKNVTEAYVRAITWAQMFVRGTSAFKFELNSDFDLSHLTPAERQQLVLEWQSEAITWEEMRAGLKKTRIAFVEDDEARDEIAKNPPISLEEPAGDEDGDDKPPVGGGAPDE